MAPEAELETPDPSATPTRNPSPSARPTPAQEDPLPSAPVNAGGSPTIASDQADYPPGGTVTLTGAGWQAGELVTIVVNDTGGLSWNLTKEVAADDDGKVTLTFDLPSHYVPDYDVTATGAQSGTAKTTFTDAATGAWQYWLTQSSPPAGNAVAGGAITYTLNARSNDCPLFWCNDVSGAAMTLTLTGNATFANGTKTFTWSPNALDRDGSSTTVTATVNSNAGAGATIVARIAMASTSTRGARLTSATQFETITHTVLAPTVGACHFAPAGSGDFSRSICWFDLTGYDATLAASVTGQPMRQTLLNGYVLSYVIKATGPSVEARELPTYSAAFLGNGDVGYSNNYQGLAGKPALWQPNGAGTTILEMTAISLKKGTEDVTGFALVGADAESTDSNESITWKSDKTITSIGALGNACGGTLVMSAGDTQAQCNPGPVANKTGAAILYTIDPTTFTQTMVGSGKQAVAFGVMVSGLQLNKQIVNKLPGDQFRISVKRSDNTEAAFALTDPTTGIAATEQVYTISSGSSQTFTLSEEPAATTNPANYATTWECTKNGKPFTPTGSATSKTAEVTMNDYVTCTITNTGPSLTLRKTVDNSAGGALTPADWTMSARSANSTVISAAPPQVTPTGAVTTSALLPVAVPVGSYTLGESSTAPGAAWYAASAWACTKAGGGTVAVSGSAVILAAGDEVTCTITNTSIPPTISVWKSTVGEAGGPFPFALTNTVQTVGTVTTSAAGTRSPVDGDNAKPGLQPFAVASAGAAVTIDEPAGSAPVGWALASASCKNDTVTVGSRLGTTYTIPAAALVAGAAITCDFSNRPIAGRVTWSKVDAGSTSTLLGGSEWTLSGPSYPAPGATISDCTATPCTGQDTDPIAGQFSVEVRLGSYSLAERTAPVGFQLDTTPRAFSITTDGQIVAIGAISDKRWVAPSLPLTGGTSTDAFLLTGLALLAAAGIGAWLHRRRLPRFS